MSDSVPFAVSIDKVMRGPAAPDGRTFATCLTNAHRVFLNLAKEGLELFSVLDQDEDITNAQAAVRVLLSSATDVFVLGIGGSSLGAKAIANLLPVIRRFPPRVTFLDNFDAATLDDVIATTDMRVARFIAISKSGGTAETMTQALIFSDVLDRAGLNKKDHFLIITEERDSPLRKFGLTIGCPILPHPLGIGGRYSVFSMVGVLPVIAMGLDPRALRAGAKSVFMQALSAKDPSAIPSVAGAALHLALSKQGRLRETVLWTYADKLKTFGPWWQQMWAESLGKGGGGSTPIAALGPVDQHSQLQLFLDGPGGALFTVVTTEQRGKGPAVPQKTADQFGVSYLGGHRAGDLPAAEARATAEALANRGRPVREIYVPKIDEFAIGALFMHFMLETIIMGRLMGVDPFDQPAVEEGKVLAKAYLEGKSV